MDIHALFEEQLKRTDRCLRQSDELLQRIQVSWRESMEFNRKASEFLNEALRSLTLGQTKTTSPNSSN